MAVSKTNELPSHYWCACVFLAFLKKEEGRGETCRKLLDEVERGKIRLFTSTFTFAEVTKGSDQDLDLRIEQFFENDYIIPVAVDRLVAEDARRLIWRIRDEVDKKLKPADAIHLASARRADVDVLVTFDSRLLGLNGKLEDLPRMEEPKADSTLF